MADLTFPVAAGGTKKLKDLADGTHAEVVAMAGNLVPEAYDYISLSYTGANLTGVVYKSGGSGGTTVATLTLGYDGSNNLTSVTRS
jgi:hypothetical protein